LYAAAGIDLPPSFSPYAGVTSLNADYAIHFDSLLRHDIADTLITPPLLAFRHQLLR